MTTVQCGQCKAPYAVFGVEPPLEYVCAGCTDPLGGPPVLSPLEERVAALEQDLRAGITRAESDLTEARAVISELRTMFALDSNIAPHRKAPYCDLIDSRCEGWLS